MTLCRGKLLMQSLCNHLKKQVPSVVSSRSGHFTKNSLPPVLDVEVLSRPVATDDPYKRGIIQPARINETTLFDYDPELKKFVNYLMFDDKQVAQDLLDSTLKRIKQIQLKKYHKASAEEKSQIEINARAIIKQAILNCRPVLTTKRIGRGGVMYRVPVYCNEKRSFRMGCNYIIGSVREMRRTKIPFHQRLSTEILSAYRNEGKAIQKKQALHKECEINRAYAHYRWMKK